MKANEFCDVTLVSNDNCKFEAHKVILASSSEVFKNLLVNERHQNPLIFMSGVKGVVLQAVLDFIYSGEANVEDGDMKAFIKLSTEIEVFGLNMDVLDKEGHVQRQTCKHWNKGFCNQRENCLYEHIQDDCETHKRCEDCHNKDCKKRHRKTCRDWLREGCRRQRNCAYLHQDTKETIGKRVDLNTPNDEQRDVTEYYPKIICKLCDERLEGNTEMKDHFIKEHVQDLNVLDAVNDCGYVFCMDISKEKCSKFCYFYKNLTELEEVTSGRVLP